MASSSVDQARALIEERLSELEDERKRLQRALADLGGPSRRVGRPRSAAGPTRRRRRRRGGSRAEQALKYVQANPGATTTQIAGALKIKPNYMYRVMAELQRDRKVRKDGKQYYPPKRS